MATTIDLLPCLSTESVCGVSITDQEPRMSWFTCPGPTGTGSLNFVLGPMDTLCFLGLLCRSISGMPKLTKPRLTNTL